MRIPYRFDWVKNGAGRWIDDLKHGFRNVTTRSLFAVVVTISLVLLIGLPLIFYFWGSVWSTEPGMSGHFTLDGYRQILKLSTAEVIYNTLFIAVVGTLLTLVFGLAGVTLTIKFDIPGRTFLGFLFIVQYLLPQYALAIAWSYYAGPNGLINRVLMMLPFIDSPPISIYGLWGIAFVGALHYAGLVYLLVSGAVRSVPRSVEETAFINGASSLGSLRKIVLPLVFPSVGIAAILVFSRFSQSFGLPLILGLPKSVFVLATQMYYHLRTFPPNFSYAAALGVVMLVIILIALAVQRRITGTREAYETVTGSEDRDMLVYDVGGYGKLFVGVILLFLVFAYILPFVTLFLTSLKSWFSFDTLLSTPFTLQGYRTLFVGAESDLFWKALLNTVLISGIGAFVGMALASLASYIIVKSDSPLAGFIDFLTLSPTALPTIVIATAFMWLWFTYDLLGLYGTIWIIILALTSRYIVYGSRASNSAFRSIGTNLEDAARISGAGLFSTLRKIFLPLIRPGFVAGYTILFIDYMKNLTVPLLLASSRNNMVLSVMLLNLFQSPGDQIAAALAVIFFVMIGVLYGLIMMFTDVDITEI